ncbi:hypothetical protein HDV05_008295 [Chytridiales sp. JEL 0842]|nr:hypothetical protein HDV05_008295 [Chytridiales sp. JEL 0842]
MELPGTMLPLSDLPLSRQTFEETESLTLTDLFKAQQTADGLAGKERYSSFADFHAAYLAKKTTPSEVMEKIISRVEETHSKTDFFSPDHLRHIIEWNLDDIRAEAKASTERYKSGKYISPLDGVPFVVKDEMDLKGFATMSGTAYFNKGNPAEQDALCVERLRKLGAVVLGKTNMDDVFGINPTKGTSRNPYNLGHSCGGSSGGTGGAIGAGFCPLGVGADGGGSIRIPAAFNGVFGLKPTHARIPPLGGPPTAPSVGVYGPLASTATDLAAAYLSMAGPDSRFPVSLRQPKPTVPKTFLKPSMKGVRVGVMESYAAQTENPDILAAYQRVKAMLVEDGAILVNVEIPFLEESRVGHLVTISSEMHSLLNHGNNRSQLSWPNRVMMAVMDNLNTDDLINAQKTRTFLMLMLNRIFDPAQLNITYLLTPTTAITSPALPTHDHVLRIGFSDNTKGTSIMRFVHMCNFAGIPGVSVPVGLDSNGLPIGIQFMAQWWGEGQLLEAAKWLEGKVGKSRALPTGKWVGGGILPAE